MNILIIGAIILLFTVGIITFLVNMANDEKIKERKKRSQVTGDAGHTSGFSFFASDSNSCDSGGSDGSGGGCD
ncbi:hypothetical protein [Priestia endophytica]|uniref:hypothetical protein n=1 Tax=Priestia endophytica TaxID=135735 RepID=UPI000DCA519F|nr:hypothetical protein [Priestia endophytica]RAS82625.1 hypothetical protein A4R27_08135 [Priestia endophytica]